jgi:hypothetical protein
VDRFKPKILCLLFTINVKFSIRKFIGKYTNERTDSTNKLDFMSDEKEGNENKSNQQGISSKDSLPLEKEMNEIDRAGAKNHVTICNFCQCKIKTEALRPNWRWNLEPNTFLCSDCYAKKHSEFERRMNYCNICNKKLGFIRYNPKPKWKMTGQMCRKCWDSRNISL